MLRKGDTHGAIRAFVSEQNEVPPSRPALSRHAIRHLKMQRRTQDEPQAEAVKAMETPGIESITDEVLKILFWRMKNEPQTIKTSELVPFATQALRVMADKTTKRSNLQEVLGQISDARSNQEG